MRRRLLAILFSCSIPAGAREVSAGLTGRVTDPAGGNATGVVVPVSKARFLGRVDRSGLSLRFAATCWVGNLRVLTLGN